MTDELTPVRCGCGGEANAGEVHFWGRCYTVQCSECGIETKPQNSESEAITAWNRAMGATDINVGNKERTAKAEWSEVDGCHLCGECGFAVCPNCDVYCAGCGARLEWE